MTTVTAREHTDAQLRAAWRVYKLSTWPATFEEAMADKLYSRLLHVHATHMAHQRQPAAAAPSPAHPLPYLPRRTWFDGKRAAAGDGDD